MSLPARARPWPRARWRQPRRAPLLRGSRGFQPARSAWVAGVLSRFQTRQGVDEDLGERREGLNRVAHHRDRDLGADGQCRLAKPLARLGPDRVGTHENAASAVGDQHEEAGQLVVVARVCGRARDARDLGAARDDLDAALLRLLLGDAGAGDLWVAERHARQRAVVGTRLLAEHVARRDAALVLADVREERHAGGVADRPHAVAGAQVLVDLDVARTGVEADVLEPEAGNAWPSPGR